MLIRKGKYKVKKTFKSIITGVMIVPLLALGVAVYTPVVSTTHAATCEDGKSAADGADCTKPESGPVCLFGADCAFNTIANTALYVIGAVSVLMLIYGGIRYTTSGGSAENVTAAKNTILYAVVGIIIAIMSYAIVNFVIGRLT
jgi:hypothetical protein